jgi:hypothetical protein
MSYIYEILLFTVLHVLISRSVSRKPHPVFYSTNNKFWGELIAYFSSIRHGPHRKQRLQQFFAAVGLCWPSYYLATMWGYTARPTDSPLIRNEPHRKRRVQQFFFVSYIRCCEGTCLPDPCLAKMGAIHIQTHRQHGDRISLLSLCWKKLK